MNPYTFDTKQLDWNNPDRSQEAQDLISQRGIELVKYQKMSLSEKIDSTRNRIEYICNEYDHYYKLL